MAAEGVAEGTPVDLERLIVHGFEVVGVELSELAVQTLFAERGLTPAPS